MLEKNNSPQRETENQIQILKMEIEEKEKTITKYIQLKNEYENIF